MCPLKISIRYEHGVEVVSTGRLKEHSLWWASMISPFPLLFDGGNGGTRYFIKSIILLNNIYLKP